MKQNFNACVHVFFSLVQASLGANTFAVVGQAETKSKYRKEIFIMIFYCGNKLLGNPERALSLHLSFIYLFSSQSLPSNKHTYLCMCIFIESSHLFVGRKCSMQRGVDIWSKKETSDV